MVICTRKHVGNLLFTGTEGQKLPSVPENMPEICLFRVQERKSGHLYPCEARKWKEKGYRKAKTAICTRKHVGNQLFTGTERQKPPSVPENMPEICLFRVQERKSGHLYPCGARKWKEKGYRRAKTASCTRRQRKRKRQRGVQAERTMKRAGRSGSGVCGR